jgi:hypothetical protein
MEDEVFDEVNDYVHFMTGHTEGREEGVGGESSAGGWADFVELGLLVDVLSAPASRIYGGVIFPKYLSEHVGGRGSMGAVWDRIRNGTFALESLDQYGRAMGFDENSGLPGLDGLYLGFAGSNAFLKEQYEEGNKGYGDVPLRGAFPSAPGTMVRIQDDRPSPLGTTYRESSGSDAALEVFLVESPPHSDWGLSLALRRSGGTGVLVLASSGLTEDPSLGVSSFQESDLARLGVSLLAGVPARDFSLAGAAPSASDHTPPEGRVALSIQPVAGGFDVTWNLDVGDEDLAGYVVAVTGVTDPSLVRTRTVLAPVTSIEVRELIAGTYDLAVWAYDLAGNEGLVERATEIRVAEAVPLPTPLPTLTLVRPALTSSEVARRSDGGKGIGTKYGFDRVCFLGVLGL